jgi:putative transcriptional regulator
VSGIAALIPKIRKRLELTQEQFAKRLGTTATTVHRWESGKSEPMPVFRHMLEEMARNLGVKA